MSPEPGEKRRRPQARCLLAAATALTFAAAGWLIRPAAAGAATRVDSAALGVHFALPDRCVVSEGPSTLDAVCDPSGAGGGVRPDPTMALLFEIVAADDDPAAALTAAALSQRYSLGHFEKDLPGSVCGDEARVKVDNAKQLLETARVVYTANVHCPEIRFLGLGARQATVRVVVRPARRLHIMARALTEDFERLTPIIEAFFASLQIEPEDSR